MCSHTLPNVSHIRDVAKLSCKKPVYSCTYLAGYIYPYIYWHVDVLDDIRVVDTFTVTYYYSVVE